MKDSNPELFSSDLSNYNSREKKMVKRKLEENISMRFDY